MKCSKRYIVSIAFGACITLLAGCSTEPRQKPIEGGSDYVRYGDQPAFTVPEQYASMKSDVVHIDINRDGYDDAVLTVLSVSVPDVQAGFDSVFVYEYNRSTDAFDRKYGAAVFYGTDVEMLNMDDDEHPETIVYTNAGGNDPVVGKGLVVVRFRDGVYNTALQLDGGNPEVLTLSAGSMTIPAVKVYGDFWPDQLSHAESVHFFDSLIVLKTVPDSVRKSVERQLFSQALEEAERDYARAKNAYADRQDDEAAYHVYNAAVRTVKYYQRLNMQEKINAFRSQEWRFWRGAMPEINVNILNQLTSSGSSS